MPKVNPNILKWARETAGLNIEEAAKKLNLNAAYGKTADERLNELEAGVQAPTRHMLNKMSKQYRRPLLTFYLSEPPAKGDRGQDFRTLPLGQPPASEGLLDALIRDVLARQSLVRAAIVEEEEEKILPFIGSSTIRDGIEAVLNTVRNTLNLNLQAFREASNPTDAFKLLREKAEQAGIFVLLLGNLGSHHTNLDVETFRGFALADDIAPFIIINDQDSRAAWSFTLLHELTHLILGLTGVSGANPDQQIEKFCNDVASEYLLPRGELSEIQHIKGLNFEETVALVNDFAGERNVSRSMVAYKVYRAGFVSEDRWNNLRDHFKNLWLRTQQTRRREPRKSDSGPTYYIIRRHRLGSAILETTARFISTGSLTTTKAGTVLGVKPQNVQKLLDSYI